jgi:hypothetical protein
MQRYLFIFGYSISYHLDLSETILFILKRTAKEECLCFIKILLLQKKYVFYEGAHLFISRSAFFKRYRGQEHVATAQPQAMLHVDGDLSLFLKLLLPLG